MSTLANLSESLLAAQSGSPLSLGGGGIGQLLETVAIVRDLSKLTDVVSAVDTPEGLQERLQIVLGVAARSAALTGTPVDDAWVARISEEVMQPEVLAFAAYLVRRLE